MNDTDRLNFILKYFTIDDIGDEIPCPGICIKCEQLEDDLSWGADENGIRPSNVMTWDAQMREVIDRAIISHNKSINSDKRVVMSRGDGDWSDISPSQQGVALDSDGRCAHCGSGDAAHHSFTCPTGLHPDRRK